MGNHTLTFTEVPAAAYVIECRECVIYAKKVTNFNHQGFFYYTNVLYILLCRYKCYRCES